MIPDHSAKYAAFEAMSPAERKRHVQNLFDGAKRAYDEGRVSGQRRGTTQGSAFLWIDLYGKSKMDTAFRKIVKEQARLIQNYRGSKNAWYLGSQSDVSHYDGAVAKARYLDANGISASQCDEWD
jgi:hypothetical protein